MMQPTLEPKGSIFDVELSFPGKTFFLGEYGVMLREPALLASTAPRFELCATRKRELRGIHPESPAGAYWSKSKLPFGVEFRDPHKGKGGLGASGAQFLGVHFLNTLYQGKSIEMNPTYAHVEEVLRVHEEILSGDEESNSWRPSGADLVSQWCGGLTYFSRREERVSSQRWPFTDLDFELVRTREKISTHDHLKALKARDLEGLGEHTIRGWGALSQGDSKGFINAINEADEDLRSRSLLSDSSRKLLEVFRSSKALLASKGCGALGADVLALFFHPEDRLGFLGQVESLGLEPLGGVSSLSVGVDVKSALRSE